MSEDVGERLKAIQDELDRRAAPKPTAAGGAFVGGQPGPDALTMTPEDNKALFKSYEGESRFAKIARATPSVYAAIKGGEAGAEKAAELTEPLPIPKLAKGAIVAGTGIVSAGLASGTAQTAYEEAKRQFGVGDDRSDSFMSSLDRGYDAGKDMASSEFWGRTASGVVGLSGFRPKLTPESMAQMDQQQGRLKGIYEKVAGTPLVTDDVRSKWNPMRYLTSTPNELDNTEVVKRLKAQGYDPQVARSLAVNGGAMGDILDNGLYESLQRMVGSTKAARNVNTTRGKMLSDGVRDLGTQWGTALPPEQVGKAVFDAVSGKFNTLNATRKLGMNAVEETLGSDFKFRGSFLKGGIKDTGGPESLVTGLSDNPTFGEVQNVRENLGVMMHDQTLDQSIRDSAAAQAKRLDQKVFNQLPPSARVDYKNWSNADDEINRGQFNTKFVQGLMANPSSYKAYANQLVNKGDLGNFKQFEAAVGPDVANQVRANIWDRVTKGAVQEGGILRPDRMRGQLYEQGRYGKTFLEGVMGKKAISDYEGYANAMEDLNTKSHQMGFGEIGTGKIASAAGLGNVVARAFENKLSGGNVALVAGILGVPQITSRVLASEGATRYAIKLAQETARGTNPKRASRLLGYTMEAAGLTPGDILAHSGIQVPPVFQSSQSLSQQVEGRMASPGAGLVPEISGQQ